MSTATVSLEAQLGALRTMYITQLPEKLDRIAETWRAALDDAAGTENLVTLHRLAHSLAGSGGTYGFTQLGLQARVLEACVQALLNEGGLTSGASQDRVAAALATLQQAGRDLVPDPGKRLPAPIIPARRRDEDRDNRLVFLVEDDAPLARDLALQIGYFGYDVRVFPHTHDLVAAVQQTPPLALLLDITLPEGHRAGIAAVTTLQRVSPAVPPVIFLSAHSEVDVRLGAVRAGGAAYFTKPLNVAGLIDKLDQLTAHEAPQPYRILIVDDDPDLAQYNSAILAEAGMIPLVLSDPMQILDSLAEVNADLILMDMYMPGCTGLELAALIRQQEAYVSIPIVYLSTETNIDKQLAAMRLGGDDFLTKPIRPEHLISAVTSRVERLRVLRSFMIRDSLTGLLNHTIIKEHLAAEVLRAARQGAPVAYALLDIDHFKQVNDTYGHPAGDRVIKSLSRLLQQRLRRSDSIGRYGGEEFAVILPHTTAATAMHILDELREGFAQVRHQCEDGEFYTTFSCGVAAFPAQATALLLNNAADKALYRAKHQGRNRVAVDGP